MELDQPFFVDIDRENPVHIFDSENLEIVLSELDTAYDFLSYLNAKRDAIQRHEILNYCGEEDLVAHYFVNFDKKTNAHLIGSVKDRANFVHIGEGEWRGFRESNLYHRRKKADETSYFWDRLIQITSQNALNGNLGGNSDPFSGKSAIHFMAREPRFSRRGLADHILQSIRDFPNTADALVRNVSLMPSFYKDTAYVFLQLKAPEQERRKTDYREIRQALLEVACAAAKLRFPLFERIIGISTDAPKFAGAYNSEDMLLMEFEHWDTERQEFYKEANKELRFFQTAQMTMARKTVSEFPLPKSAGSKSKSKSGRNDRCYCGSGIKYKHCCL